jgi:hypothetical protein
MRISLLHKNHADRTQRLIYHAFQYQKPIETTVDRGAGAFCTPNVDNNVRKRGERGLSP